MKPVKQSELLDTILAGLGILFQREERPTQVIHPREQSIKRHLRVLLAEDNAVNQMLATLLLEKQGHTVVVAGNGREAWAALEQQPFDLVLMDVEMPEMNGFEATALVRAKERETGRHIPIIALTAHALKGDQERCLQAGMDGYISKPVRAEDLSETMEKLLPNAAMADSGVRPGVRAEEVLVATNAPAVEEAREVFDRAAALARVGGKVKNLSKLAAVFLDECPKSMAAIRDAIVNGNAPKLGQAAHPLRGAVAIFCARRASDALLKLEMLGRAGDLRESEEAYAALEKEINQLIQALAGFVSSEAPK
jgi:CheY-like chemotaxis protein